MPKFADADGNFSNRHLGMLSRLYSLHRRDRDDLRALLHLQKDFSCGVVQPLSLEHDLHDLHKMPRSQPAISTPTSLDIIQNVKDLRLRHFGVVDIMLDVCPLPFYRVVGSRFRDDDAILAVSATVSYLWP